MLNRKSSLKHAAPNISVIFMLLLFPVNQAHAHAGQAIKLGECDGGSAGKYSECRIDRRDVRVTQVWLTIYGERQKVSGALTVAFSDGKIRNFYTRDGIFYFDIARRAALPIQSVRIELGRFPKLNKQTPVELWGVND